MASSEDEVLDAVFNDDFGLLDGSIQRKEGK